ncbi:hypothetical protein BS47DRAFT_1399581 [Hydnum rufescens UP504]|uniref:Nephrocystin 3-like N-terminal domain-containing protein n=1 Tax=Hydnum rufescens UP504 TaxID=1448309 RepID=A0A9P6AI74_9AGAM|nr:hypothetical protein BS47DRAFT_1399581 [Hydnum rufescens UP504]
MDKHNISSGLKDELETLRNRKIRDVESISSNMKAKSSASGVRRFFERENDEHDLRSFTQISKRPLIVFSQTLRQEQESHFRERSAAVMSLPRANSAGYDSGREDGPSSCLDGTRGSILAEIMSWSKSTESGMPPWADKNGMLGRSFFFSRSNAPLRDLQLVFPTLAFQLAQSNREFKNVIGEAIQQDMTLGHKAPLAQLEGLILKPLGRLESTRQMSLIVLDAVSRSLLGDYATVQDC